MTTDQHAARLAEHIRQNGTLIQQYLDLAERQVNLTLAFAASAVQDVAGEKALIAPLVGSIKVNSSPTEVLSKLGAVKQKLDQVSLVVLDTNASTINIYGLPETQDRN